MINKIQGWLFCHFQSHEFSGIGIVRYSSTNRRTKLTFSSLSSTYTDILPVMRFFRFALILDWSRGRVHWAMLWSPRQLKQDCFGRASLIFFPVSMLNSTSVRTPLQSCDNLNGLLNYQWLTDVEYIKIIPIYNTHLKFPFIKDILIIIYLRKKKKKHYAAPSQV